MLGDLQKIRTDRNAKGRNEKRTSPPITRIDANENY
jgi:hypothetical protein